MATQEDQQGQSGQRQSGQGQSGQGGRGFAGMDDDRQRDIAAEGGRSVPDDKRSFSQDRELAAEAGRRGGEASGGGQRNAQAESDDRENNGETQPRDEDRQFRSKDDSGRD